MEVQVLLVDDEQQILNSLIRIMRRAGITTASANSAEEALAWLEDNTASLILSDYRMPEMSGTDLLANVEARWPDTSRIILSAHSDFDTVLKAVQSGVVHKFLAKPWSNQELIEHIKTSLASLESSNSPSKPFPSEEKQLRSKKNENSDLKLQVVLDTVMDGIVTINKQGIILSTNSAMETIFGYSPLELEGNNISTLMPEPYKSQHDLYLKKYKSPGTKGVIGNQRRLVGVRKNGEVFPIELSVNRMEVEGSTHFLGMIRDISARVKAERENQLLLDALETAQDGMALFGIGDRLIHCNQQFRQLYSDAGVELNDSLSYQAFFEKCLTQNLYPEGQSDPKKWIEKQLEIHQQLPVTKEYELRPGQWIEIHETLADNGSVIVSHLDISKQKHQQITLQKAVKEAELANSARGRFLAMMSHEIRTPLNGVLGLLQLLQETPLTDTQRSYVDNALSSGRGLQTVISDILDFSKIEADKLDLIPAPCNLKALVIELQQLFRLRVEEKSIALNIELTNSVPEWVEVDGSRLRQVLINLLGNAIKFTDYGHVNIAVGCVDSQLQFVIEDTGIGIPEDEQKTVFSEFTTLSNTTNREGTGLGLSISNKLVGLMGGELKFTSRHQVGSKFWFNLPLVIANPASALNTGYIQSLIGKVLVVDDSDTNRLVARKMLETSGVDVICAADGYEAINIYNSENCDLILMDIAMPGMDGVSTLQKLRELDCWRDTPVIAFTAYAQVEDKHRFTEAGMKDHIEKPLEKSILLQKISPYLVAGKRHEQAGPISASENIDEPELFDCMKLNRLATDTSEEVLPELAAVFMSDTQSRIQEIQSCTNDLELMQRHIHTLGSSAQLYGLMRMSNLARKLEASMRDGDSVVNEINGFIQLVDQSLKVLEQHLQARNSV